MTPADLSVLIAENVTVVMAWVGSGILGALSLFFVFLGIRKGFEFFGSLVSGGDSNSFHNSYEAYESFGRDGQRAFEYGIADGATRAEAWELAENTRGSAYWDGYVEEYDK